MSGEVRVAKQELIVNNLELHVLKNSHLPLAL